MASNFNRAKLEERFIANDWALYGPDWIEGRLKKAAAAGYENSTASIVAKLLLPTLRGRERTQHDRAN